MHIWFIQGQLTDGFSVHVQSLMNFLSFFLLLLFAVTVSNVSVQVINATMLMVSWDLVGQLRWTIHHYTIYYSAFSPVLYKVIDESTIEVPPNKTSEAVVIRELEAGVEHRFQVTASLEIQGEVYEGEKSILTEDSRVAFGKPTEYMTKLHPQLCHSNQCCV